MNSETFTHPEHEGVTARVVADSIDKHGYRLTTMLRTHHRFILAEDNTHGDRTKSSASTRAISLEKQIAALEALIHGGQCRPVSWTAEQRGMSGAPIESPGVATQATGAWVDAAREAIRSARGLQGLGIHKSLAGRLLEPFMMHTTVHTATSWGNYLFQRDHEDAQPEMRALAEVTRMALAASTPKGVGGRDGEWPLHLPFVEQEDILALGALFPSSVYDGLLWRLAAKVSAARVARTSYLTLDGKRDVLADLRLFRRLYDEQIEREAPIHWAPAEHVAAPAGWNSADAAIRIPDVLNPSPGMHSYTSTLVPIVGRYLGWVSYRHALEARLGDTSYG